MSLSGSPRPIPLQRHARVQSGEAAVASHNMTKVDLHVLAGKAADQEESISPSVSKSSSSWAASLGTRTTSRVPEAV
jgi:hypothetical protein